MPILPPLPPLPKLPTGFFIWSSGQWNAVIAREQALADRQQLMYAASEMILETFGTFTLALENLMTQDAALTASVAAESTAVADLVAQLPILDKAISDQIAATDALRAELAKGPPPSPAVAAAITAADASTASLLAAKADMAKSTAALVTDTTPPLAAPVAPAPVV